MVRRQEYVPQVPEERVDDCDPRFLFNSEFHLAGNIPSSLNGTH